MSASSRPKILIVDDEVGIRELLSEILIDEGYAVVAAENADAAWDLRVREKLSLILLDIWMPGKDGLTLLKQWRDAGLLGVPIVVMSGHATIDTAVEAMKLGALEVLEKPIAANRLLVTVQKSVRDGEMEQGSPEIQRTNFGRTEVMRRFKTQLLKASVGTQPVLMVGPPNAGATFYAQMFAPPRGEIVFIDRSLQLQGELGPILRRAAGGLIVVNLIDMLNPAQQSGLLALTREAARVDARVVAASLESPETLAGDRGFNRTLLQAFRHVVRQPPLADYIEDIPYTVDIVARRLTQNTGMSARRLSPPAVDLLARREYENDFLELQSLVRCALMYAVSDQVDAENVRTAIDQFSLGASSLTRLVGGDIFSMSLRDARLAFEKEYFRRLMEFTENNVQQAIQISGLERTYLYRKLKQYKPD
ncbi:MAG: sigma-54-dependent transcriptional regulator [Gammaproteobacteria bacterium]